MTYPSANPTANSTANPNQQSELSAWFSNIPADLLAGVVVALALIPEATSSSIIAILVTGLLQTIDKAALKFRTHGSTVEFSKKISLKLKELVKKPISLSLYSFKSGKLVAERCFRLFFAKAALL